MIQNFDLGVSPRDDNDFFFTFSFSQITTTCSVRRATVFRGLRVLFGSCGFLFPTYRANTQSEIHWFVLVL